MLALSFTFPAGSYHATPWDRHVNEGAVAWPPEPWRIVRGLVATWHHKVGYRGEQGERTLSGLVDSLARELPEYALPAASHGHSRHYMPQFAAGDTRLIFDAFTAVGRDEPLTVVWPTLDLPDDERALLDELLCVMGYLGRAESWVEARRVTELPQTNCRPGIETLDTTTGEIRGEAITLLAPLPAAEYHALRDRFLPDKKATKKLGDSLPESLLGAISVDTSTLRKAGWNQPPAARRVGYLRPLDALEPKRSVRRTEAPFVTTASFLLVGKPLPRVEDSLRIGELARRAVMGQAGRCFGEKQIPPCFSGHDLPAGSSHRHAFYLPWDENGDGRIERLVLHVPSGIDASQQRVLGRLDRLWGRDGGEWRLVLEGAGGVAVGGALTRTSETWESVTPYLHPWHRKKRLGIEDQIRRELRVRGMLEPLGLERLEEVLVGASRRRRPIHFRRFRDRHGIAQPDRLGSFWRITFPAPVAGPLALGFACHFGLGLFRPLGP